MNTPAKQPTPKAVKTAITPTRADDFPEWYQQVIKAADLAENSPVRGCMIIKPNGYAIWELMQRIFDDRIKACGVQNAYFPLLIPLSFLSREAEHVEGFAKECAVVTHHRLEKGENGGLIPSPSAKLEEPFVIRPTSETIIGDAMSRWVQSYRDLPMKLNQWCNVMRWELRTRMFLRTSEFLWQEGHNAFETAEEAQDDSLKMLDMYVRFASDYLALPSIPGKKTEDEKFPGAVSTYTFEGMMQDGKALQLGTSHDMGQNFAKSLNIKFQGRAGQEQFAYTTSWGITTRLIGALIMTHSDDDGLILPPKIAPHQVAIIPVIRDENGAATVLDYCNKLATRLKAQGIRVNLDSSDARTPDKMWAAIKRGVPVRVEAGQREVDEGKLTWVRRDLGKDSKTTGTVDEFVNGLPALLDTMQKDLLEKARAFRDSRIFDVKTLAEAREFFASNQVGFVSMDTAFLSDPAFASIQKDFSVTTRCLPFADEGRKVLIGRSY